MSETVRDYDWLAEDMRAFIRMTEESYPPDATEFPIAEQRAFYDRMCRAFDRPHPPGLHTEDRAIAGVPCRLYTPREMRAGKTVVFFHGGGFILGGLRSHDAICAELSAGAGANLIAVDYRLSPEHLHPAAFDDAMAVCRAVEGPKVLVGDSAGGNLAATVAANLPGIAGQVLIYPGLGGGPDLPSYTRHAQAPLMTLADAEYYTRIRLAPGTPETALVDPTLAPLQARGFGHLPPTALFAAECDPLASDAVEYAARLTEAGVPVTLVTEPGLVHGYLRARHMASGAQQSFARITQTLAALAGRAAADQ